METNMNTLCYQHRIGGYVNEEFEWQRTSWYLFKVCGYFYGYGEEVVENVGIKSGCVMTKSKVPQEEVWSEYKGTDEPKNVQIAFLGF